MMEIRPPKQNDQDISQEAYEKLCDLVQKNPHIESSLWASACWSAIVDSYYTSGATFQEFQEDLQLACQHYKKRWEMNNG